MGRIYTKNKIKAKVLPIFSGYPIEKAILFGSYAKQAMQFKEGMSHEEFSDDSKTISACAFNPS